LGYSELVNEAKELTVVLNNRKSTGGLPESEEAVEDQRNGRSINILQFFEKQALNDRRQE
jgi:hypothetical protein